MLSIIIPVYNAEKYLKECIDSVLKQQDFNDYELICVNDGSTDNSLEILQSYNEPRMKVITQENQGAGVARNNALDISQGDYIMFLDSDDTMVSGQNTLQIYKLAQENKLDILLTAFDYMTEDKKELYTIRPKAYNHLTTSTKADGLSIPQYTPEELGDMIFQVGFTGTAAKIIRRDFINNNKLRFLTLKRSEDFPFVQLSLIIAKNIGVSNISLNKVRIVNTSLEHTKDQTPLIFQEAETQYYTEIYKRGLEKWLNASHTKSMDRLWGNLMAMQTFEGMKTVYDRLPELYEEHLVSISGNDPIYERYEYVKQNIKRAISCGSAGDWLMYRIKQQEELFNTQLQEKNTQLKKLWQDITIYNQRPIIKIYNHLSSLYHRFK